MLAAEGLLAERNATPRVAGTNVLKSGAGGETLVERLNQLEVPVISSGS
jgi:hypothetical protein